MGQRIYLSPPHLGGDEWRLVKDAIDSNWIAPLGPHVEAFEREFAAALGIPHALAVASGTAALHLAVKVVGVRPGDEVLCSTFTFAASANAIAYEGGRPVFIDSEPGSWNMDPELLAEELAACAARGKLPRAVVVVDVFGQSADHDRILAACARHGIPVIEDAAQSLGATYRSRAAGTFGACGIFSFNGNKIMTTSGGGMLVSSDPAIVARARFFATQARDPAPHYEHSAIGYNYRLSNLLAALGRAQLATLPDRIAARRRTFERYCERLRDVPGVGFMPEAPYGVATRWLTCITIDPEEAAVTPEDVRRSLEAEDIESRPLWKPMHLQPVYRGCRVRGGAVSERLFRTGLSLPSGCNLSEADVDRVANAVRAACSARAR